MAKEPSSEESLVEVCRRDPRYPFEAYEFLLVALGYIQHQMGEKGRTEDLEATKQEDDVSSTYPPPSSEGEEGKTKEKLPHVTGQQLAEGCRDLARKEFGLMARTVFGRWGINSTDDLGEMVYNLIEVGLLKKTETDKKEDFHNVYDLDQELRFGYRIELEELSGG
jgi:uncharacterized repeat protein (TIGR04138 family)